MSRPIIKKEEIVTERLTLHPYRTEDRDRLVEMIYDYRYDGVNRDASALCKAFQNYKNEGHTL